MEPLMRRILKYAIVFIALVACFLSAGIVWLLLVLQHSVDTDMMIQEGMAVSEVEKITGPPRAKLVPSADEDTPDQYRMGALV